MNINLCRKTLFSTYIFQINIDFPKGMPSAQSIANLFVDSTNFNSLYQRRQLLSMYCIKKNILTFH